MIPRITHSIRAGRQTSAFTRGADERRLRIFIDDDSLRAGALTTEIVRGFVGTPILEVETTSAQADPHVIVSDLGDPHHDVAFVDRVGTGKESRALVNFASQKREIAEEFASPETDLEALTRRMLLADRAERMGFDVFITDSPELQRMAATTTYFAGANIMNPTDGIAAVGLYLRLREDFAYLRFGRSSSTFGKRGFYAVLSRDLLPDAVRWLRHAPAGDAFEHSKRKLAEVVPKRVERALYARDRIHQHLLGTQTPESDDEILFHLEALLFAICGAFDAVARMAHAACGVEDNESRANWRGKVSKPNDWLAKLAQKNAALANLMGTSTPQRDVAEIAYTLRNFIHGEGLSTVEEIVDRRDLKTEHRLLLPHAYAREMVDIMERIGGHDTWGVHQVGQRSWVVSITDCLEQLFSRSLTAIDVLMRATPVENLTSRPADASTFAYIPEAEMARDRIRLLSGLK